MRSTAHSNLVAVLLVGMFAAVTACTSSGGDASAGSSSPPTAARPDTGQTGPAVSGDPAEPTGTEGGPAATTAGSGVPAGDTAAAGDTIAGATTVGGPAGGRWRPGPERPLTLHWVLGGPLDLDDPVAMGQRDLAGNPLPEPDVYDIDGQLNAAATVRALQAKGKQVICYFDAGVYESYRPDASRFPQSVIGAPDEGWDNSWWLDIRQIAVLEPIMRARIEDCRAKGFDAVEPDEIDGYANESGFPLTAADQLAYNRALASWVHEAGLSVGLKGDIEQAADLVASFDWTLNEECFRYEECDLLAAFTDAGKAVWIAEYRPADLTAADCADAAANRWNAARYQLGLPTDGGRQPCGGW